MTDVTEKMLNSYVQKLCAEQESLIARFLAETKLKPSEICLVEQPTENGRVFYPEKADRLEQIQKLNERIDEQRRVIEKLGNLFVTEDFIWNDPISQLGKEAAKKSAEIANKKLHRELAAIEKGEA